MHSLHINNLKQKSFALSIIIYPLMLFIGFVTHPNLLEMQPLFTVEHLVNRFHNNPMYHIGHLVVTFAVPVIIVYFVGTMNLLQGKGLKFGFWGEKTLDSLNFSRLNLFFEVWNPKSLDCFI